MRLLVLSPYYPPHMGGLETHSAEWNEAMGSLGYSITLLTPKIPSNTSPEESFSWGIVLRYPAFEIVSGYPLPKFWHPSFWKVFFRLLKSSTIPDVVVTRTRFFFSSFLGLIYTFIVHRPLVHIEHGSDFVKLSSPLTTRLALWYDHTFGRLIFRCATRNIAISQAVSLFIKRFDQRETPVIYRGIDTREIDSIPSAPKQNKVIITTAARLYAWKGISNTVEAIRLLGGAIQGQIEFRIIGDGEDMERLKEQSQGLPIAFFGARPRQEVIAYLKASDIFVHSSYPGGGLSTSLLEALACDNAVVATPHEGANEIIQDQKNGLLLTDSNPEEIATALRLLIDNPALRQKLSETGSATIKEQFNWKMSALRYHKIFESL
jgi:glycosyltransferase involved in cell wall biosynthesis